MTRQDRARRLDHAVIALTAGQSAHGAAVLDVLASRLSRCSAGCKGWFIDPDRLEPARCDSCAIDNGYAEILRDDDLLYVPEVLAALRRAHRKEDRIARDEIRKYGVSSRDVAAG